MTETEPLSQSPENESRFRIEPSTAEGRGRLLLMGGMGWLAIGTIVDMALIVWGGIAIIAGAFALNTAGKLVHYHELPIPGDHEAKLAVSWLLLGLTIIGLLVNYAYSRYGAGDGSYFWALAVAGVGFGLLHMAAQSMYLPEESDTTEG